MMRYSIVVLALIAWAFIMPPVYGAVRGRTLEHQLWHLDDVIDAAVDIAPCPQAVEIS